MNTSKALLKLIDKRLSILQRIEDMTAIIDQLVASDAALLVAVNNLIANDNTLKADLTAAIAASGMSAADQAAVNQILSNHSTAVQAIADTLVKDAPAN